MILALSKRSGTKPIAPIVGIVIPAQRLNLGDLCHPPALKGQRVEAEEVS
jgi:hypothetical protein